MEMVRLIRKIKCILVISIRHGMAGLPIHSFSRLTFSVRFDYTLGHKIYNYATRFMVITRGRWKLDEKHGQELLEATG